MSSDYIFSRSNTPYFPPDPFQYSTRAGVWQRGGKNPRGDDVVAVPRQPRDISAEEKVALVGMLGLQAHRITDEMGSTFIIIPHLNTQTPAATTPYPLDAIDPATVRDSTAPAPGPRYTTTPLFTFRGPIAPSYNARDRTAAGSYPDTTAQVYTTSNPTVPGSNYRGLTALRSNSWTPPVPPKHPLPRLGPNSLDPNVPVSTTRDPGNRVSGPQGMATPLSTFRGPIAPHYNTWDSTVAESTPRGLTASNYNPWNPTEGVSNQNITAQTSGTAPGSNGRDPVRSNLSPRTPTPLYLGSNHRDLTALHPDTRPPPIPLKLPLSPLSPNRWDPTIPVAISRDPSNIVPGPRDTVTPLSTFRGSIPQSYNTWDPTAAAPTQDLTASGYSAWDRTGEVSHQDNTAQASITSLDSNRRVSALSELPSRAPAPLGRNRRDLAALRSDTQCPPTSTRLLHTPLGHNRWDPAPVSTARDPSNLVSGPRDITAPLPTFLDSTALGYGAWGHTPATSNPQGLSTSGYNPWGPAEAVFNQDNASQVSITAPDKGRRVSAPLKLFSRAPAPLSHNRTALSSDTQYSRTPLSHNHWYHAPISTTRDPTHLLSGPRDTTSPLPTSRGPTAPGYNARETAIAASTPQGHITQDHNVQDPIAALPTSWYSIAPAHNAQYSIPELETLNRGTAAVLNSRGRTAIGYNTWDPNATVSSRDATTPISTSQSYIASAKNRRGSPSLGFPFLAPTHPNHNSTDSTTPGYNTPVSTTQSSFISDSSPRYSSLKFPPQVPTYSGCNSPYPTGRLSPSQGPTTPDYNTPGYNTSGYNTPDPITPMPTTWYPITPGDNAQDTTTTEISNRDTTTTVPTSRGPIPPSYNNQDPSIEVPNQSTIAPVSTSRSPTSSGNSFQGPTSPELPPQAPTARVLAPQDRDSHARNSPNVTATVAASLDFTASGRSARGPITPVSARDLIASLFTRRESTATSHDALGISVLALASPESGPLGSITPVSPQDLTAPVLARQNSASLVFPQDFVLALAPAGPTVPGGNHWDPAVPVPTSRDSSTPVSSAPVHTAPGSDGTVGMSKIGSGSENDSEDQDNARCGVRLNSGLTVSTPGDSPAIPMTTETPTSSTGNTIGDSAGPAKTGSPTKNGETAALAPGYDSQSPTLPETSTPVLDSSSQNCNTQDSSAAELIQNPTEIEGLEELQDGQVEERTFINISMHKGKENQSEEGQEVPERAVGTVGEDIEGAVLHTKEAAIPMATGTPATSTEDTTDSAETCNQIKNGEITALALDRDGQSPTAPAIPTRASDPPSPGCNTQDSNATEPTRNPAGLEGIEDGQVGKRMVMNISMNEGKENQVVERQEMSERVEEILDENMEDIVSHAQKGAMPMTPAASIKDTTNSEVCSPIESGAIAAPALGHDSQSPTTSSIPVRVSDPSSSSYNTQDSNIPGSTQNSAALGHINQDPTAPSSLTRVRNPLACDIQDHTAVDHVTQDPTDLVPNPQFPIAPVSPTQGTSPSGHDTHIPTHQDSTTLDCNTPVSSTLVSTSPPTGSGYNSQEPTTPEPSQDSSLLESSNLVPTPEDPTSPVPAHSDPTNGSLVTEELYGLKVLFDGNDPAFDLVAVHGLDGHRENTWTAENGVLWLRDHLPGVLPNARIFTYGYDGRTHGTTPMSCQSLHDLALGFIADLSLVRRTTKTEERPIIFLAHSIGGIILKSALIHANATKEGDLGHHEAIKTSTYGILYFGTPHQGTKSFELKDIFLAASLSSSTHTNETVVKNLGESSEWLQQQNEQYTHISGDFETKFFYETYKTEHPILGSKLVVPKGSAVVPGKTDAEAFPVHSDHAGMVKFKSAEESGFQRISLCISLMAEQAPETISTNWRRWKRVQAARKNGIEMNFKVPFKMDYRRNPNFTGRKGLLNKLSAAIPNTKRNVVVLHGLGGIGKTEIALEYIYAHMKEYSSIFWITATTEESTISGFREIANRLIQHGRNAEKLDYLQVAQLLDMPGLVDRYGHVSTKEEHAQLIVRAVNRWFNKEENQHWLLVFDNFNDLGSFRINTLFPSTSYGNIIITTRRPVLARWGDSLEVGEMTEEEGLQLLFKITQHNADEISLEDKKTAPALVKKLGYLPLAIDQAGAYVAARKIPLGKYTNIFDTNFSKVFSGKPEIWSYEDQTVLTTWEISFEAIKKENGNATELLLLCSFLNNEKIFDDMLRRGTRVQEYDYTIEDSLASLLSYSLVQRKYCEPDSFHIHPIVHHWALERQKHSQPQFIRRATDVVTVLNCAVENPDHKSTNLWVLAHIEMVLKNTHTYLTRKIERSHSDDEVIWLNSILRLARICRMKGGFKEKLQFQVKGVLEKVLVKDHPYTLVAMSDVGSTYSNQGRWMEAERLQKHVVKVSQGDYGMDHRDTRAAMTELAVTYRGQRLWQYAEQLELHVVKSSKTMVGEYHPETLAALASLAVTYTYQEKFEEAEKLQSYVVEALEKVSGKEDPNTLAAINNLASTYLGLGQLQKAEELGSQCIEASKKVLGREHPDTLSAISNLALTYRDQGRLGEAEDLQLQVVEAWSKVFGEEYPDTLKAMGHLASTYLSQKRLVELEKLGLEWVGGSWRRRV